MLISEYKHLFKVQLVYVFEYIYSFTFIEVM